MANIAFTFWQNDQPILDLWVGYYSRYFDKIFVTCCDTKPIYIPHLEELKTKYEGKFDYEMIQATIVNPPTGVSYFREKQQKFLASYRWTCYTDADEYLLADPKKYKDLKDLMDRSRKPYISAECYDIIQVESEGCIDYTKPYLEQRKYMIKNIDYNKTILGNVPLLWNEGFHQIVGIGGEESKKFHNTGLYMLHLKHSDLMAEGRDYGPLKVPVHGYYLNHSPDQRIIIPEWMKKVL